MVVQSRYPISVCPEGPFSLLESSIVGIHRAQYSFCLFLCIDHTRLSWPPNGHIPLCVAKCPFVLTEVSEHHYGPFSRFSHAFWQLWLVLIMWSRVHNLSGPDVTDIEYNWRDRKLFGKTRTTTLFSCIAPLNSFLHSQSFHRRPRLEMGSRNGNFLRPNCQSRKKQKFPLTDKQFLFCNIPQTAYTCVVWIRPVFTSSRGTLGSSLPLPMGGFSGAVAPEGGTSVATVLAEPEPESGLGVLLAAGKFMLELKLPRALLGANSRCEPPRWAPWLGPWPWVTVPARVMVILEVGLGISTGFFMPIRSAHSLRLITTC